MNEQPTPITDEELHAYVDGLLDGPRRDEIERQLERNEELAARVSDYFSLNNMLHERYDRVLSDPLPARLKLPAKRRWLDAANWPQFAGLAAALVLGIGIGVGTNMGRGLVDGLQGGAVSSDGPATRPVSFDPTMQFARQSAIAHVMYAPDVIRPAEITADQEQDLVRWVSQKLGTDVHPPLLSRVGFELIGGRLLPGDDGPVAQFMYNDAHGQRVTLCISHRKISTDVTAFKLYMDGPVNVFYWIDGDFGYAVSGAIDRKELLELSHDIYAQLTMEGGPVAAGAASSASPASPAKDATD